MPTDGPIGGGVTIDFLNAEVSHSNLGGYGPNAGGEPNVRFTNVGQYLGRSLDLVITADARYEPHNTDSTKVRGMFGPSAHPRLRPPRRLLKRVSACRQGKST